MNRKSEAARAFHDEIREKKRAASGVHYKTGRNGYVGKMLFPSDILSRKEKMEYRRSSKVMISNMYDEILPINEFEDLGQQDKKHMLHYWRTHKTQKEILDGLGISNGRYYAIVNELELPVAPRTGKRNTEKRVASLQITQEKAPIQVVEVTEPIVAAEKAKEEAADDGLNITYKGTFAANEIIEKLSRFELLLDGNPDEFYVELRLKQKQPK